MSLAFDVFSEKSRLKTLLDHFSVIDAPHDSWRVAHPLPEILLQVVCGAMADRDDFDGVALWGEYHLMAFPPTAGWQSAGPAPVSLSRRGRSIGKSSGYFPLRDMTCWFARERLND